MIRNAEPPSLLAIEIIPVHEGDDYFYRVVVFDVDIMPDGKQIRSVRDILHFDALSSATGFVAENYPSES